jgi:glycosyltransferase involved in cell wall biosynthesis
MNEPVVSVLMPTYNYAHYIAEAIQSVLDQTYQDFELIIVDDRSSDNTDDVVKSFLHDKRIKYYKNEKNLGLVGNFNKCLDYAKGKYIKYLLADDKFDPHLLAKFIPVMEANPGISLATSDNFVFGIKSKVRKLPLHGLHKGKDVIFHALKEGRGNWIGEPTVVIFRKSAIESVGKFSDKYICLVDLNMWLRLLMTGDCYIIPEPLSYFRQHPKQASSKTNVQNWLDEYNFYKDTKVLNPYGLDQKQVDTLDIDKVIKNRAVHCSKGMFRILHKFYKPRNRRLIRKAFKVASKEKVLMQGFFELLRKRLPSTQN